MTDLNNRSNNKGEINVKRLSGAHVPHRKNTAAMQPEAMPVPASVTIPMSMHIGAPATLIVKAGDEVKVGQVIGEASGFISAPVHSSVSGKVKKIAEILTSAGSKSQAVVIETDGEQTPHESVKPQEVATMEQLLEAVKASGAVGLGGAGFPTAAKLTVKDVSKVEAIIINGAECEPYITSDTRTMIDDAEQLIRGAELLLKFFTSSKVLIGIEKNKPEPIKILTGLCSGNSYIEVCELPSLYPQGGEKVLVYNLTGKMVPEGKLPLDVGAIVINCTTLVAVMKYIETGMPLVSKCLTVDGSAIKSPKNVIAPIGTPIEEVLAYCDVDESAAKKVLLGGPMMGIAVRDPASPIMKSNNAILAFNAKDAQLPEPTACIRCGRCVRACPMRLMPLEIETAYQLNKAELLEKLKVNLCMECGCCSFSCPASRPLVQTMKLSKPILREYQSKKEASK